MPTRKILVSTLLAVAFVGPACAANEATSDIEEAHRAYYMGQSGQALKIYRQLAAAGDAEAAERAGFMLLIAAGEQPGKADIARATALLVQAARAGRHGAVFVLGMLGSAD